MDVHLSEKVQQFCTSKKILNLVIDLDYQEAPCTQIYTPIVRITKKSEDLEDFISIGEDNGIKFYRTSQFSEIFGDSDIFTLELKGLLKKHITIMNIDPIIKNVCKMPGM